MSRRPLTVAEIQARIDTWSRPAAGGHTDWTGPREIEWRAHTWRPAALIFYLTTGRTAHGYARADCGHRQCVTPAHIDDQTGRNRTRTQLRALRGLPPPPATCRRGHDQTTHGQLKATGNSRCAACAEQRREQNAA